MEKLGNTLGIFSDNISRKTLDFVQSTNMEKNNTNWIISLYFDVEKLYRKRIDLEDIALAIENKSCNSKNNANKRM